MPAQISITTEKTILSVAGTVSSNTQVVAAVPFHKIKVIAFECYTAYSGGTISPILTDGNGGSTLHMRLLQAAAGGISGAVASTSTPSCLCSTSNGNALYLNPNGQSVTYTITYFADDAS